MMVAVQAALLAWQPQPAVGSSRAGVQRRSSPSALALDDAAVVVVAGTILAAAGYLQYCARRRYAILDYPLPNVDRVST